MMPDPDIVLPPNPGRTELYKTPFSRLVRKFCWLLGRCIWTLTFRQKVINPAALDLPGGYQIACTHLSHLEPFLLGIYSRRPVDWMTRIEFYRAAWMTWFLLRFGAIPVRRQGVSANGVRAAIERLKRGRVVAIAPEGGVAVGPQSVCRGGPVKHGASLIALRSGKPIIPCVILGSHDLNRVGPWLPFRRARLWIAFGDPIYPPPISHNRKADRLELSARLQRDFCDLYQRLLTRHGIDDSKIP